MIDIEETFLHTAINEVLPHLPKMSKDTLEENLQSLVVETYDDFEFLKEEDLLSVLRPIQARKVLAAWKLRWCSCFTARRFMLSVDRSIVHDLECFFCINPEKGTKCKRHGPPVFM